MEDVVVRFVPPQRDKSWSFQMHFNKGTLPASWEFTSMFSDPDVKPAAPFLQGHSGTWAMVEFWVAKNEEGEKIARKAAEKLAKHFKVEMQDGDFTRADLGLQ